MIKTARYAFSRGQVTVERGNYHEQAAGDPRLELRARVVLHSGKCAEVVCEATVPSAAEERDVMTRFATEVASKMAAVDDLFGDAGFACWDGVKRASAFPAPGIFNHPGG